MEAYLGDLAVSDAERAQVRGVLQRSSGLLSSVDFTARMDKLLAARTRGELDAVLIEIPGIRVPGVEYSGQSRSLFSVAPPLDSSAYVGSLIRSRLSSVIRTGPWQVPGALIVENRLGNITLDFTQAKLTTQVVDILIDNYCGTVDLVLPAPASADFTGVHTIAGSIRTQNHPTSALGPLHLFVHGKNVLGRVRRV